MSNMPNVQQASAVSQGAQASISEANRMAATREQMRGQQAMQQQAMQARAAEAEKERGFQAQRDQQQMALEQQKMAQSGQLAQQRMSMDQQAQQQNHQLKQQMFAEQQRVQKYEEAEAQKLKELNAERFKVEMAMKSRGRQDQDALVARKTVLDNQYRDASKKLGMFKMLVGKSEAEVNQIMERIPQMQAAINRQIATNFEVGASLGESAYNAVGDTTLEVAKSIDEMGDATFLGFDISQAGGFDGWVQQTSAREMANNTSKLFGGAPVDPTKSIWSQVNTPETKNRIARQMAMGPIAEALGNSLAMASEGKVSENEAIAVVSTAMNTILVGDGSDVSKDIEKAVLATGMNGALLTSALTRFSELLRGRVAEFTAEGLAGPQTLENPNFLAISTQSGIDVPTGPGLISLHADAMEILANKLDSATASIKNNKFDLENTSEALAELGSLGADGFFRVGPGQTGFGSQQLSQIEQVLSEDLPSELVDPFIDLLEDFEDTRGELFTNLPAGAVGDLGDLIDEELISRQTGVTDAEFDRQSLLSEMQARGARGDEATPAELASLLNFMTR